jgi:PGF-CTERM protein
MRRRLAVIAAVLLLCAGFAPAATAVGGGGSQPAGPGPAPIYAPADPSAGTTATAGTETAGTEEIGVWNGTAHDADLDVDQSDGLTEAELRLVTDRAMARVEVIRDRPFREDVPVETMTREEFRTLVERDGNASGPTEFDRWNDGVWKALFIVGEDSSASAEIETVFSGGVTGFYSFEGDRVVIVTAAGEEPQISGTTLIHELTHALQDQYHNLSRPRYTGETQDADLAIDGVVEGEAVHVENRYGERCGDGWDCIGEPDDGDDGGTPDVNFGVAQLVQQPYADGQVYVYEREQAGGWAAVNASLEEPPASTTQVIHRTDREPVPIEFEDAARGGWETYPDRGVNGSETVGEASVFVMFWYQAFEYGAETMDWRAVHLDPDHEYYERYGNRPYNYAFDASDGWGNDKLYPYRNGDRDGYVWVTEWTSRADAAEFAATYRVMLEAHDVERRADGVRVVPDGPFRGAYGIERDGTTVTIVHGPEPADVFDLRPGIEPTAPDAESTPEPTPEPTGDDATPTPDAQPTEPATGDGGTPTPASDPAPGFGPIVAVLAVAAAALLARQR